MKRWYVLQVYPGYEERVKKEIQNLIERKGFGELFGRLLVPSAKLKPLFDSVAGASLQEQQLFPGYILIEMELVPQAMGLVLASPRVVRFLGGDHPMPMSTQEINRIDSQVKGEIAVGPEKEDFVVGQSVEVIDNSCPFTGFVGVIDRVDRDSERLTVMVSIFGRMTPVELGFHQ
ncbi:MAG TPA: transcription termination/antitermination protein NusG, partial [Patescibacteria group bacterium]|nr:transcription termination/antitermination protein NusG [Patescibacteria group bacterium]